jgi:hypothetical protein
MHLHIQELLHHLKTQTGKQHSLLSRDVKEGGGGHHDTFPLALLHPSLKINSLVFRAFVPTADRRKSKLGHLIMWNITDRRFSNF